MIPTQDTTAKHTSSKRSAKPRHNPSSPVVDSTSLDRIRVTSIDDPAVDWHASFATCGGNHSEQSSTIVYEIAPGGHLGWHTDATEETQYIIDGTGELQMEDGKYARRPGQRVSCCRPTCATTSSIPVRSRCARLRSLPPPCSHRTSTTSCYRRSRTSSARPTAKADLGIE